MKKTKNNNKLIENIDTSKIYEPMDAIKILKENSYTKFEEVLEVALIENIQREDLNSIEEAEAFAVLQIQFKLNEMPRSSSRVRYRNRCELTGRPRGVYKKFGLSRIKIRELSLEGKLPGVIKSSW